MREFTGTWMRHSGDFWGGFAAMLVALPASVAFGVTVFSAVSPHYAAFGALAGILGAAALGLIVVLAIYNVFDTQFFLPVGSGAYGHNIPRNVQGWIAADF